MSRLSLDLPRLDQSKVRASRARHAPDARTALRLAGFPVRNTCTDRLTRFLTRRIDRNRKIAVGFVNQNFVVTCRDLHRGPCTDDSLILVNDGIGMQVAALLRLGRGFRENLNGTDFVPHFLRSAGRPLSVYLVGSEAPVLGRAAAIIDAWPGCRVIGQCDGFSLWQRESEVIADIAAAAPDVLLVGLGNPIQERWVLQHWDRLDARIIFGVGALFEWLSGHRRRAPRAIRELRLEWMYRLMLEPRRLGRRYTLGILQFFALVLTRPATGLGPEATP